MKKPVPLFKVFMPRNILGPLEKTLYSGYLSEGKKALEFEGEIQAFLSNPRTLVMSSCTMALTIAYRLAGVEAGSEVISTPLTSIASNVPILALGGKIVWADVERNTGMLDPLSVRDHITSKTKAILVLHKEGDLAKLDEINMIAKKYGIKVIEDSAHAFGAKYKGKKVGNTSDFACFSFQAIKHISCADGGALACKDPNDYERAKRLKWFGADKHAVREGSPWDCDIKEWGYKGDLNDVLATIGLEQMKHVRDIIQKCNANGKLYQTLLQNIPGVRNLDRIDDCFPTFWGYTLLTEDRQGLIDKLKSHRIDAMQIHPRNDKWSALGNSEQELPNVDYFNNHELSLPSGWWVSEEDIHRISNIIKEGW